MRIQIKTSLSDDEYRRFDEIREYYGFSSNYALAQACINVCTALIRERMHQEPNTPTVGGEIIEAFVLLASAETTPDEFRSEASQYSALTTVEDQDITPDAKATCNSDYAATYISRNYAGLSRKYSGTLRRGTSETPQDVLHDTLLSLYTLPTECETYEDFLKIANEKLKYTGR